MNISFVATSIDVSEGEGVIKLVLRKTEGAIGPVSIRIYTEEGTAIGTVEMCSHKLICVE